MTFGSLFAGIGGLDLGLERAGMTCKWQVEIDDYANRVLAKHWPAVRRWRDITTFPPEANNSMRRRGTERGQSGDGQPVLHGQDWQVELICGGFPCQDISYAGKGAGLAGERSGLFYEAIRVVRLIRPRYVLLENVAALLTRGLDDVLGTLASVGYDCEWHCIQAADVGAPHIRDRAFIIGYVADAEELYGNGRQDHAGVSMGGKQMPKSGDDRRKAYIPDSNSQGLSQREGENPVRTRTICRSKPARGGFWVTEPDVGRVANGIPSRVDRLRCLGNAVVPQVAEYLGRCIMQHAGFEPVRISEGDE